MNTDTAQAFDLDSAVVPAEYLQRIPLRFARENACVAIGKNDGVYILATARPERQWALDRAVYKLSAAGWSEDEFNFLRGLEPQALASSTGCDACFGTGFSGRTGIYEFLMLSDAIRDLVITGIRKPGGTSRRERGKRRDRRVSHSLSKLPQKIVALSPISRTMNQLLIVEGILTDT